MRTVTPKDAFLYRLTGEWHGVQVTQHRGTLVRRNNTWWVVYGTTPFKEMELTTRFSDCVVRLSADRALLDFEAAVYEMRCLEPG